ncbi:MAG: hypothetical protein GTO62_02955 [Planctomycetales bacterium]|nr:hypothetical protein [Planctomycetales bacterium]NIP68178.1 hypothetical protein [Planctomycetales bacterium]
MVVLGGRDALAFNRSAVDEQVQVWRQGNGQTVPRTVPQTVVRREMTIERYGQADRCLADKRFPATDATDASGAEMIDLFAICLPQADPGQGQRLPAAPLAELTCPDEILQLTRATPAEAVLDRLPLSGDEWGMLDGWGEQDEWGGQDGQSPLSAPAAARPSFGEGSFGEDLSGLDWLFVATAILIIAFRMGLGRVLNQLIFLWTARWQGVTVVPSSAHRRSRRRRSSRTSRWPWQSTRGSTTWTLGARPSSARGSRRRSHWQTRSASRSRSAGSAPRGDRRGGREYVVADIVFTANGPIARRAAMPQRGLLTSAIPSGGQPAAYGAGAHHVGPPPENKL